VEQLQSEIQEQSEFFNRHFMETEFVPSNNTRNQLQIQSAQSEAPSSPFNLFDFSERDSQ